MKSMKFFKVYILTIFLTLLLFVKPTVIVYHLKGEERQFWELISNSPLQKGTFKEEPQEIVFVYRKKKIALPSQATIIEPPPAITPPANGIKSTQYGEILRRVSGTFLFGSVYSKK